MNVINKFLIILLLLAPIFTNSSLLSCGTNIFQQLLSGASVLPACPSKFLMFNDCCKTHDKCYNAQEGQNKCDNDFCECLILAADGSKRCDLQSKAFCQLVKKYGSKAYIKS